MRPIILCAALLALCACSALTPDPAPMTFVCAEYHVWSAAEQKRIDEVYNTLRGGNADLIKAVLREWISLHRQAESCQH